MKFGIVLKAGYLRGITLNVTKEVTSSQATMAATISGQSSVASGQSSVIRVQWFAR
jgi:hypothetical protein